MIKLRKSQIFRKEISFLGRMFSDEGITMDEKRIAVIKCFPRAENQKGLRAFLGAVNYNLTLLIYYLPLLRLLKKATVWKWSEVE